MKNSSLYMVLILVIIIGIPLYLSYYLSQPSDTGFRVVIEQHYEDRYTLDGDCKYWVETDVWVKDWKGFSDSLPFTEYGCATDDNLDSVKVAQMNHAIEAKEELLKKYPELKQ